MQKTKTNPQLIAFALMSLFLFSCSQNKESKSISDENGVREIKVDLTKSKEIDLADFADEVKYIKLETTEGSLFANIYKLIINSNGIFILDEMTTKKVFHFSLEGKFINTIGKVGRGADEYVEARDVIVDEVSNTIEIIDGFTLAKYIYSIEGEFIRRDDYKDIFLNRIQKLQNGNYFVKLGNNLGPEHSTYLFAILTPNLKSVVKYFLPSVYPSDFSTSLTMSNSIENSFIFTNGIGEKIYQYMNDSILEKYTIDYEELRVPDRLRSNLDSEVYKLLINRNGSYAGFGNGLYWNKTYIFYNVLYQRKDFMYCYNMQTNENSIYSKIIGESEETYSRPKLVYKENLVFSLAATAISENEGKIGSNVEKNYGVFSSLKEVQECTSFDDNPILVFMKPKSDL